MGLARGYGVAIHSFKDTTAVHGRPKVDLEVGHGVALLAKSVTEVENLQELSG